jgi:hypothetical protein
MCAALWICGAGLPNGLAAKPAPLASESHGDLDMVRAEHLHIALN